MLNMLSVKKGENHMGNQIYKEISKFAEMQRDEIKREKAKKKVGMYRSGLRYRKGNNVPDRITA